MSAPARILPERYDPAPVESKWQGVWEREDAFAAEPVARDGERAPLPDRPKAYVLEMLPYPSGEIHMGHVKNYTMGDVVAHQRRRSGVAVFHPMGYDAFGLPAENAAIRTGEPPATVTARNIARIREQLRRLGFAIDWHTEIATSDPEYYRWTQWLFLRFFERGLAERREAAVNWCPKDQTVLANEQVIDGRCERCGTEVELRQLTQWFLRITDYAQRLLDDMDELVDWPERVLTMQRNWIGRSEGARVVFRLDDGSHEIPVFTTRPDTLFGATFFILAPEHPLLDALVEGRPEEAAVREYFANARRNPNAQAREWHFEDADFARDSAKNLVVSGRIQRQDCSQVTDGAACVVLATAEWAADHGRSVDDLARISGWGHRTSRMALADKLADSKDDPYVAPFVRQTVVDALGRAGVGDARDLDAVEVHDCFTTTEYLAIDHLGLTEPGESWRAIEDGTIGPDGDVPINPSGGLIGGGHPVGATGVRMVLDAAKQVTGTAGDYQVDGARTVATLNLGGSATTSAAFVLTTGAP